MKKLALAFSMICMPVFGCDECKAALQLEIYHLEDTIDEVSNDNMQKTEYLCYYFLGRYSAFVDILNIIEKHH